MKILFYFLAVGFFSIWHYWHYFFPLDAFGTVDFDFFLTWRLAFSDAIRQGSLLTWMPWQCGGVPALANPQSGVFSPVNLFALFLNPVLQMKAMLLFNLLGTAIGFLLISRILKWSYFAAFAGFMLWSANGFIGFRILHGQLTFFPFLLLPLLLAAFEGISQQKFETRKKELKLFWSDGLAIFSLLLILLQDGFQVLIYGYFFLGILALFSAWEKRSFFVLRRLIFWGIISVALASFRLIPMLELLRSQPRLIDSLDFMNLKMLKMAFLNGNQKELYASLELAEPHRPWMAYGAFVGWPSLISICAILFYKKKIKFIALLVSLLISLVLMMGSFSSWAPWPFIHALPIFDMVRFPNRFASVVIMALAILFAMMIHFVRDYKIQNKRILGVIIAISFIVLEAFVLHQTMDSLYKSYVKKWFAVENSIKKENSFIQVWGNSSFQSMYLARNQGLCNCYRALELPNHCQVGKPLVSVVKGAGQATGFFESGKIRIVTESAKGVDLMIHQNFDKGWQIETGRAIGPVNARGLMVIGVEKGRQEVVLKYTVAGFSNGILISLFTLLALLFVIRKQWDNQKKKGFDA